MEVALVMVEFHPFLCTSTVPVDSLLWHVGKEGSSPFDFHKLLPGVFLSQALLVCAQETELSTIFVWQLWRKVC